jgi:hypothetical protein
LPNVGNGPTISELSVGVYNATITDSNNCITTIPVNITEPNSDLSSSTNFTDVTCNGLNNGTASVIVNGGTPNYTYLWMPGNLTTSSVSNLTNTTYSVTVTDNNGCNNQHSISISEPTPLLAKIIGQVNVSCFGGNNGEVTVNAQGGNPGYTFLWLPVNDTNATINSLLPNTYTVVVTDTKGCTATNSATITQPNSALGVTTSMTPVLCFGNSNGTASSIPSGGTEPYTYNWTPGNNQTQNLQLIEKSILKYNTEIIMRQDVLLINFFKIEWIEMFMHLVFNDIFDDLLVVNIVTLGHRKDIYK